jgi:hypothetical protein
MGPGEPAKQLKPPGQKWQRDEPDAAASTAEGREPNAHVAHGEAVQVPRATTRDLLGLGSE